VKEYAGKYDLTILAFCLMENHIHFIVVPHTVDSLAKAFNTIHIRYSQYLNRKARGARAPVAGKIFLVFYG